MAARYALAFSVATWIAIVGGAFLRRRARGAARTTGSAWALELRSAGGALLAVGTLAGCVLAPVLPARLGASLVVAALLTVLGLFEPGPLTTESRRLLALTVGAVVAVLAGVRDAPVAGARPDVVFTAIWIVGVAYAVSRLDHTDGLLLAIVIPATAAFFALAGFDHDHASAIVAVALSGAGIGLLAYGLRPASLYVARAGALFSGFLVAVLSVEVDASRGGTEHVVAPLLVVAVPLLDLLVVTASRLRRGQPVGRSRRDHLYHRLTRLGLKPSASVALLAAVELGLAATAVVVGRGVVAPVVGIAVAVVVGGALVVAALGAAAPAGRRTPSRRARRTAVAVALGVGVVALAATAAGLAARRSLDRGQQRVEQALAAARRGETEEARRHFAAAADQFETAERLLDGPLGWPALAVPFLAPNVVATADVAGVGVELARAGERLVAQQDPERLRVRDGTVPVAEVRRVTPDLEEGSVILDRSLARVDAIDDAFLLSPVDAGVRELAGELAAARREARNGVAAARLAPAILGDGEPRRYFLAVQNSAELRGTGGLIGSWGILTAEGGSIRLERFERTNVLNEPGVTPEDSARVVDAPPEFLVRYGRFAPAQVWQNLNMSPDFPTVGRVIAGLYPQIEAEPVDGVIGVDPEGLAALLGLTGPVRVEGWPEPLTPDNVVAVTLSEAYDRFANTERVEFIGDVARQVVDTATSDDLGSPARIGGSLGPAARDGHLVVYFTRPEEQELALRLGVAGAVPPVRSDTLAVTNQNAAGNKIDYYLRRHLDYQVTLTPNGEASTATVRGTVGVRLDNTAPVGVSSPALGPYTPAFQPGENRSFVSIYTPSSFTAATLDGDAAELEAGRELGRNVYSQYVSVPAGASRTLALDVTGSVPLRDGSYTLDLVRQPAVAPDDVDVSITVPDGWRIRRAQGLTVSGARHARGRLRLDHTTRVEVVLERDPGLNLWDRLVEGT